MHPQRKYFQLSQPMAFRRLCPASSTGSVNTEPRYGLVTLDRSVLVLFAKHVLLGTLSAKGRRKVWNIGTLSLRTERLTECITHRLSNGIRSYPTERGTCKIQQSCPYGNHANARTQNVSFMNYHFSIACFFDEGVGVQGEAVREP